jgi:formate dehydrogenase subunit gamma
MRAEKKMTTITHHARRAATLAVAAVLAVLLALTIAAPADAQQVNPRELSVQEEQLLQQLQGGEAVSGRVSIPNPQAGNLITPAGRDWSNLHRGTMFYITVGAIVGMLVLLAVFYLIKGKVRIDSGWSGRTLQRFNSVERFGHWLTATTFILLALTGLNLVVGRVLILPLVGEGTFGAMSAWAKVIHNYVAWPFMLGLLLIFGLWVRDNIPSKVDAEWLRNFGGFFKRGVHPPAWRFNAGQKMIFWSVILGGTALSVTGIFLIFPELNASFTGWQWMQTIHGIVSAIMIAIILAHIYIGSVGMEGAFDAMASGEVDLNWAREHHSLWVEDELGRSEAKPGPGGADRPVAPAE